MKKKKKENEGTIAQAATWMLLKYIMMTKRIRT